MSGKRRRRWSNILPTLGERLVFAGANDLNNSHYYFVSPSASFAMFAAPLQKQAVLTAYIFTHTHLLLLRLVYNHAIIML